MSRLVVIDYRTGETLSGAPAPELVEECANMGPAGVALAWTQEDGWSWRPCTETAETDLRRQGYDVRSVYVEERMHGPLMSRAQIAERLNYENVADDRFWERAGKRQALPEEVVQRLIAAEFGARKVAS